MDGARFLKNIFAKSPACRRSIIDPAFKVTIEYQLLGVYLLIKEKKGAT